MFSEGRTQTSFFSLSGESAWRVLGERRRVQSRRQEGNHPFLEVIYSEEKEASLPIKTLVLERS